LHGRRRRRKGRRHMSWRLNCYLDLNKRLFDHAFSSISGIRIFFENVKHYKFCNIGGELCPFWYQLLWSEIKVIRNKK
jgi:hypothetical protein